MTDENDWTRDNQSASFESQDVYFPKPLPKPSSIKRELFIDYGNPSNVYLYSTSGRAPLSQKQYFQQNDLYAKNPTLPMADSALKVDYPFVDRVMGDNLSNIKKARSFCYYVNKIRGAWLSKVPYNHLKPLKRVIDDLKNGDCNIHATLDKMATPSLRKYIYDFQHLLTANIETYNSDYVGGCLTSFKTELGKNAVCFPSGKTFSKLSIRHISPDETDNSFYHYDEEMEINIGSSIYEVGSTVIRDTGYCALRCDDNKCHLLTFHHADFSNTLNTIETVGEKPTSMCLSPYIEGESLIATDSGTVHIWRVGKGLNAVILNKASRFHCNDKWRQVHYGACPQELVVADRTVVEMFDRRTSCESSIDLFALPNKILVNSERISAMQGHPTNPYYHIIATDYSLLLVDQRFPGHSVMYWNHLLLKTPSLMSVYQQENYNSSLILLASQYPAETSCYQFQQTSNDPVYSTQAPWRLSKISDICQFDSSMLNTYSLLSEKRLDTSLCGITVLPGPDKQSLLTLQLDCHGELFYQVYSTNYSKDDLTCSAGPGYTDSNFSNDAKLKAKTWMSSLESHVSQFCEERDILKMTIYDHSDKYHDLKQTQPGHVLCPLCLPKTYDSDDDDSDDEPEETCPSCSLPLTSAKTVYESEKEGTIADITCNGFEMFDSQIPPYTKLPHASAHSGILINLWKDEPNISKLVIEADKNAEKYKQAHQRKLRKLAKKAERRKEHFKTLRRNGHDLNEIYFKNNRNPTALDHFLKELAALYTGEDPNQIDDSESVVSMSTTTMSTSGSPGSKNRANLTLLASESQNLTLLQQMNPSTGSSSHTDAMSVRSLDFSPTGKKSNKRILSKRLQQMQGSDSEASGSESRNPPTNSSKRKSLHKTLVSPSQKSIEGFKIPSTPAPKRRRHNTDNSSSSTVIEQNTQDDNFKIMEQLNESVTTDNQVSDVLEKSTLNNNSVDNFKYCTVSLERLEDTSPNETENSVQLETVDVDQSQVEESAVKTKKKKKKKKHNDTESSGDSDISVSSSTSNQSMFSTVFTENDREVRKQKKKKKHKDTENSGDSDISVISNTSNQSMFSNAFTENDTAVRKQKKKKKLKNHNEKETDTEHGSLTDLFSSEDDGSVLSLISGESDLSEHSVPQKLKHKKKQKKSKDNLEDSTYNIVDKKVINNILGAIDTYENQNPISYCSKENETNVQNNRDSVVTDDKKDVAHIVEEYDKVTHETTPKETPSSLTVISSEAEDNLTFKLETDSDHGSANSKDGLKPTLKTEIEELPLHDSIPPSPYSVVDSEEKINVMSIPDISKHSQSFAASPVYNPISDKRKKGDCQSASRYLDFGQTLKDKSTIEDVNGTDARPTAYGSLELLHLETESFSETLLQGDTVKVELEDSLNIKKDNQTMSTVKSQDETSSGQSSVKEQKQFSTSVVGDPYPTKHINVTRSTPADDISIVDRSVSPSTSNIKSSPLKHKLGKSGSPSKKDRNKNRTSVSPPESNRNDSPSKSEKGSSPSKSDRNVSTSKNRTSFSSPESNRNDSPSKRQKSSSSSKREKSSSPSKSKRNVSPTKRERSVSPSKSHRKVSPSKRERSVSPSKSHRKVSPSKRERSVSPSKKHRKVSPSKRERSVSPSKSYRKVSPSKSDKSVSLCKSDTSISLSKNDSVSPSKKYRRVSSSASDGSLPPSKSHSNSKKTRKTSILPSKQSRTKSDKGSFSNKIRNISSSKSDKTHFSKIDRNRKISPTGSDEIKNNPPSNSDKTSFSKIDKDKNVSPVEWNETLEPSGYLNESVSNVFDDSSTFSPTLTSTQLHHKPVIKNKPLAKKKKKTFVIGF